MLTLIVLHCTIFEYIFIKRYHTCNSGNANSSNDANKPCKQFSYRYVKCVNILVPESILFATWAMLTARMMPHLVCIFPTLSLLSLMSVPWALPSSYVASSIASFNVYAMDIDLPRVFPNLIMRTYVFA